MNEAIKWIRHRILPASGVIVLAATVYTWAENRFEALQIQMIEIEANILLQNQEHQTQFVGILDDSEELLIERMLTTTDEVQEQQRITVATLQDLHFKIGKIIGMQQAKE